MEKMKKYIRIGSKLVRANTVSMFFWKDKFTNSIHSFCQYQSSVSDVGAKCWVSKIFHWASEKIFYLPSGQVEMFLICQPLVLVNLT